MLKLLIWFSGCCFILSFATVRSYESIDETFTDLIMSEIAKANLQGHGTQVRLKRQTRETGTGAANRKLHRSYSMNPCCYVEVTREQKDYFYMVGQLSAQCINEMRDSVKHHRRYVVLDLFCIMECMGQKFNFIDDKKNLNETGFEEHVIQTMAILDHHKAIADETVNKCLAEAKVQPGSDAVSQSLLNGRKCSDLATRLHNCVNKEFAKSCPSDLQDPSEFCMKFRQMLENDRRPLYHSQKNVEKDK